MLERLINLTPNKVLLIKGPASVKCDNNVTVLGTNINDVTVRYGKVLPFETNRPVKIKIRVYVNGNYNLVDNSNVGVSIWKDAVKRILGKPKRVMIVGATDTGKSTLTTYLSNIAYENHLKVGVIDGDVGQGDLAPPACIGAAQIRNQLLDLRDVSAEYYRFIGFISPMGVEKLVVDNMKEILDRISITSDICLINTDGYIDEQGMDYKITLAKVLEPDIIINIGNYRDEFKGFDVVVVNPPSRLVKTRMEREERRLEQYAKFINGAKQTFEIKRKNFAFMDNIYDSSIFKHSFVCIEDIRIPLDILKGMFVGLGNGRDVRGFGLITKITSEKITVRTRYRRNFDTVMLSIIILSHNMRREKQISLVANRHERSEWSTPP